MYRSIIEIKENVNGEALRKLREIAVKAFDNRAGKVENSSTDSHRLVFEGGEDKYGCLDLGVLNLGKSKSFVKNANSWQWLEDDPGECCDMLELLAMRQDNGCWKKTNCV